MDTHTAKVKGSCEAIPVSKLATWQEQSKAPEIPTNVSNTTVNKSLNKRFSLWKGDITCLKVDCIVNSAKPSYSAKPSLLGGSCIDGAIHKKARPALIKEGMLNFGWFWHRPGQDYTRLSVTSHICNTHCWSRRDKPRINQGFHGPLVFYWCSNVIYDLSRLLCQV